MKETGQPQAALYPMIQESVTLMRRSLLIILMISICVISGITKQLYAEDNNKDSVQKLNPVIVKKETDEKTPALLPGWYLQLSSVTTYITFGPEIDKVFSQVEDFVSGGQVKMKVLNFDTQYTITPEKSIKRAPTYILPTGNVGFGISRGRHIFEFDFGILGMVPLGTINVDTPMIITEVVDPDPNRSPLGKLGFVDPVTGIGRYNMKFVMNEEINILSSALYYEYIYGDTWLGQFSIGASAGLMIFSMRQQIEFSLTRTDSPAGLNTGRIIDGLIQSTAVNDVGPIFKLYAGYRHPFIWGTGIDIRLGVNYGFVTLNRDLDGTGSLHLGSPLSITFPVTSISVNDSPFYGHEKNTIELLGVFIQAGILF